MYLLENERQVLMEPMNWVVCLTLLLSMALQCASNRITPLYIADNAHGCGWESAPDARNVYSL